MAGVESESGMSNRLYIMLARAGDIISVFPLLKSESDLGQRPSLMVQREFAGLMEGISYADCTVFDGHWLDLDRATAAAKAISDDVKCIQCTGSTETVKRCTYEPSGMTHAECDSFCKEPYRIADKLDLWRTQPRLVFDRRNRDRELGLRQRLVPNKKKVILVAVSGISSPFPYKRTLLELLRLKFKTGYAIVDLSEVKADAFYDLLGLYESAHCLIASDSAPLHLAQACPNLPVVALVQDKPTLWYGSAIRANHICFMRYSDFGARAVEILDAVQDVTRLWWKSKTATIIHAWSAYELTDENRERHEQASSTWNKDYDSGHWLSRPTQLGASGRDSHIALKDSRRFPFVKDVIRIAAMSAPDDKAIICLTRYDTCFGDTITDSLLNENLPVWSHRTIRDKAGDTHHPVCDFFAFTLAWWKEHQEECPDLILSPDPWWPRVFMSLLKKGGGRELPNATYCAPGTTKVVTGIKFKDEAWNEDRHRDWQAKHGPIVMVPMIQDQIKTVIVNRHALLSAAYNPSIIRHDGKLLMAYRWHSQQDFSTALAISEIDEAGNVRNTKQLTVPKGGGSYEDPRFFLFNGEPWLSYVDSTYPTMPPKCVTKYGKLKMDGPQWSLVNVERPPYPDNDMTGMTKNLVFFQHGQTLMCIYQSQPEQIIYGDATWRSPSLHWKWGFCKGGTAPVPYREKLLRFFHSTLDNEVPPNRRRYYLGAMLMEPNPPFQQIALSSEPIVRGSEIDALKNMERAGINHYKPKVIFPGGCVDTNNGWIVSAGVNDSQCALITVTEGELKL